MSKKSPPSEIAPTHQAAADAVVTKYVPWSMGVGFVPVPLLVVAGLAGIQIKMLSDISKIYGVEFSENRVKSILASLLGGIVPGALSGGVGGLIAAIPFVGMWLLPATMPLLSGAATYAVGKVFIQHFESGGTFINFDALGAKQLFAERFEEGKAHAGKFASSLNAKISQVVDI
jgi:uncharacterized protein (DUF697 family)